MSKQACQKEILCMGLAVSKLSGLVEQLDFLKSVSERNYIKGKDVDITEIEASTARAEQVIAQANEIAVTLMTL